MFTFAVFSESLISRRNRLRFWVNLERETRLELRQNQAIGSRTCLDFGWEDFARFLPSAFQTVPSFVVAYPTVVIWWCCHVVVCRLDWSLIIRRMTMKRKKITWNNPRKAESVQTVDVTWTIDFCSPRTSQHSIALIRFAVVSPDDVLWLPRTYSIQVLLLVAISLSGMLLVLLRRN